MSPIQKKAPEGAFLLCLVTRSNYLVAALRLLMNNLRLQLLSLFALTELTSGQLHSPIKHQSILFRPHHKHTTCSIFLCVPSARRELSLFVALPLLVQSSVLMVEPPGTAPGSCMPFKLLQRYNTIYNTSNTRCQPLFQ